jgi:hypothetical protein
VTGLHAVKIEGFWVLKSICSAPIKPYLELTTVVSLHPALTTAASLHPEERAARLEGRWRPRKTDVATKSQNDLNIIASLYNNTPRKCLGFKTPNKIFNQQLLHFKWDSTAPPSRE